MRWVLLGSLAGCEGLCDAGRVGRVAREFAGPDAIECTDIQCSVDAHDAGEASLFEQGPSQGIDSTIESWVVTNAEGLWFFRSDTLGAKAAYHCIDPVVTASGIECASIEPAGNHYAVCGGHSGSPAPIPFDDR
ncbi:MAG: hypothetical protein R3F61_27885 [Myxococcota bacterium]